MKVETKQRNWIIVFIVTGVIVLGLAAYLLSGPLRTDQSTSSFNVQRHTEPVDPHTGKQAPLSDDYANKNGTQ